MDCPPHSDRAFGPRIAPACRSFDFTLYFEDVFFGCLPAAVFLVLAGLYAALLIRRQPVLADRIASKKQCLFLSASLALLFPLQIAFLAVRVQTPSSSFSSSSSSSSSLAADVLAPVSCCVALGLVFLSRQRSLRQPTVLSLFLSISVLLNTVRTRTFWLLSRHSNDPIHVHVVASLQTAILALLLSSVVLLEWAWKPTTNGYRKKLAPEQYSSFWSRTAFLWLSRTFWQGHKTILALDDLPSLDSRLSSSHLHSELANEWRTDPSKHSLLLACFRCYLPSVLAPVVPRLFQSAFSFAQPFLIDTTLQYVAKPNGHSYGKGLIGAWALVYLGLAVSSSAYQYQTLRFVTRLRGGLLGLVYDHAIKTRTPARGPVTAVALMGTDVERIVTGLNFLHETWASLLEVAVACYLLGRQMGVACLAPLLLVGIFLVASARVAATLRTAQVAWIERVQERLRVTASVLGNMKAIKMLGLTSVAGTAIEKLRVLEIQTSKVFRTYMVTTLLLSLTPINLAPLVTFVIYTIMAVFWHDETLLAARAFTSIALIGMLTNPVTVFIQGLPPVIQSLGNFARIQEFCTYGDDTSVNEKTETQVNTDQQDIRLSERYSWDKNGQPVALTNTASIRIPRGAVLAVVGPVGSGKSSLLQALLGEMVPSTDREPVAFCPQQPWLFEGTIRDNIVGASQWDETWYSTVCSACCLDSDLGRLARGDQTAVGSKGVNLSGGQKQRVTLARAVYSRHKIVLLDDVFSGMDARTSSAVSRNLIGPGGLLRRLHTTVLLTSNTPKLVSLADSLIVLDNGNVVDGGVAKSIPNNDRLNKLLASEGEKEREEQDETDSEEQDPQETPVEQRNTIPSDESESTPDLRRRNGDMSVYSYYLSSAGYASVACYVVVMAAWVFSVEFSTVWISWWSDANAAHPNSRVGFYIGIYAALGLARVVLACATAWIAFLPILSRSAMRLHTALLETALHAPFWMLSSSKKTASGSLLNRFGEDIQLVDMDLPTTSVNYTSTVFSCLAKAILLAVYSRALAVALPVVLIGLYFLQRFYLQTSRQLRLLAIEAKAPLYASWDADAGIEGATVLRAFHWTDAWAVRHAALIDRSQRPAYLQRCVQFWLAFVLQIGVGGLGVAMVGASVTWGRQLGLQSSTNHSGASHVGVALVVLLGLSETLVRLLRSWTQLESSIGAVARIKRFVEDTEGEEGVEREDGNVTSSQTAFGSTESGLVLDHVVAAYDPQGEPVLSSVSLTVPTGQHVAICGRTGSGKSSLMLTLVRMLQVRSGRIVLDGNVLADPTTGRQLSPEDVRALFNVVPQDPFVLPGSTVREHLDPHGLAVRHENGDSAEDVLVQALQRVGLWDRLQDFSAEDDDDGTLDVVVDDLALSAGQMQLLCVSRALVRHHMVMGGGSKQVVVLDEATSSLDDTSAALVQDIVNTDFRSCTVLAIMHRLTHVADYDRVVVMDNGVVVESGAPEALLAGEETRFARLWKKA